MNRYQFKIIVKNQVLIVMITYYLINKTKMKRTTLIYLNKQIKEMTNKNNLRMKQI